jgi:hypothetical protein
VSLRDRILDFVLAPWKKRHDADPPVVVAEEHPLEEQPEEDPLAELADVLVPLLVPRIEAALAARAERQAVPFDPAATVGRLLDIAERSAWQARTRNSNGHDETIRRDVSAALGRKWGR